MSVYRVLTKTQRYLTHYVNSFTIETENYIVHIDTGLLGQPWHDSTETIFGKKHVVLSTHGHWDHIGRHASLQERGAIIHAHMNDYKFFTDHAWHWNHLFGQFENEVDIPEARKVVFSREIGNEVQPDVPVIDGEELHFDDLSVLCMHMPGHSAGSVCYLDTDAMDLFVGDTLMGDGFFTGIPQYTDYSAYIHSLNRLKIIQPNRIFSNHAPVSTGSRMTDEVAISISCAGRIKKAVHTCLETRLKANCAHRIGRIAEYVCASENRAVGAGACLTVLAHLKEIVSLDTELNSYVQAFV